MCNTGYVLYNSSCIKQPIQCPNQNSLNTNQIRDQWCLCNNINLFHIIDTTNSTTDSIITCGYCPVN